MSRVLIQNVPRLPTSEEVLGRAVALAAMEMAASGHWSETADELRHALIERAVHELTP